MKQLIYATAYIMSVFLLLSCAAPQDISSKQNRMTKIDNYGTFGNDDEVTVLTLEDNEQKEQNDNIAKAKKRAEERKMEQMRREIAAAQKEQEREKEREEQRKKDRERLSGSDESWMTSNSVSSNRTIGNTRTSSYNTNNNGATDYTSATSSQPRQYSNSIYPTKGYLKVVDKSDAPKLKKYNVVIASILMEDGVKRLTNALDKANEPYFLAKSDSYFTVIVGSFDKKEDAMEYRIKILDKYPRRYSESELFNTYGIIFSDTWILEAL